MGHHENFGFIPSAMGSLWRVLTGEQCDQFTFSKDHSAMWKSDLVKHEAGRLMGKLYYPVGDSG